MLGLAVVLGSCRPSGHSSSLSLELNPGPSCSAVPVACTHTLHLRLDATALSAPLVEDIPFSAPGSADLGAMPTTGTGVFRVIGENTALSAVFAGTSGTFNFTSGDDKVVLNVSCSKPSPCQLSESPTPTPTPPFFVSGTNADVVLGEPDFQNCDPGANGIGPNVQFEEPDGLMVLQSNLWLADRVDGRVNVFQGASRFAAYSSNVQVSFVVGQSSITNTGNGSGSNQLDHPRGVCVLTTALYVADTHNNRGPVFLPPPAANNASSSLVLGQTATNNNTQNNNQVQNGGLHDPWDVLVLGSNVWVSDSSNNRVLRFHLPLPAPHTQPAPNLVLGQTSLTGGNAGTGSTGLSAPGHLASDGTRLYVADAGNNRVLVWLNAAAIALNATPADLVLGQPDFNTTTAASGATGLAAPRGVTATKDRLGIADTGNNRVLIWQPPPTANGAPATQVLGQASFTGTTPNYDGNPAKNCRVISSVNTFCTGGPIYPDAHTFWEPGAVWLDGNALWVSDTCNNRTLRFTAR